jgi:predicted nuclease of predicted toxin-antitoxin system
MALMRLLTDENIPLLAIELLRKKGHDVLAISEIAPSICDEDVMLLAEDEGRILLTFDKDFGELVYSSKPRPSCGIILFRIPLRSADYIAEMIVEVLDSRSDWSGHFAVVEPGRIRLREL